MGNLEPVGMEIMDMGDPGRLTLYIHLEKPCAIAKVISML